MVSRGQWEIPDLRKEEPKRVQVELISLQSERRTERQAGDEQRRRQAAIQRRKELQRRKQRRRDRLFLTGQFIFVIAAAALLLGTKWYLDRQKGVSHGKEQTVVMAEIEANGAKLVQSGNTADGADYASQCGLEEVEMPVKRSTQEVLAKLGELAGEYALIEDILQNASSYPENMLEALANNPEMADFVAGYLTAEKRGMGGITEWERQQKYPLFLQWDPRWGYVSYGDDSNIGLAGCGPVSLSMALYYLTGNESLTPDKLAAYAMENGYYMYGTGTQWALMEEVPALYGIKADKPGISADIMRRELDAGKVLICAMRPGDFTAAGHFIVIYGYDDEGFLVNDPNCVARSRRSWSFERIGGQIKQLWALGA